jgi:hypothetical protein
VVPLGRLLLGFLRCQEPIKALWEASSLTCLSLLNLGKQLGFTYNFVLLKRLRLGLVIFMQNEANKSNIEDHWSQLQTFMNRVEDRYRIRSRNKWMKSWDGMNK